MLNFADSLDKCAYRLRLLKAIGGKAVQCINELNCQDMYHSSLRRTYSRS